MVCLVEQVVYLICLSRTPQYIYGWLTLDRKVMWSALLEKGLIFELIAIVPLNFALGKIYPYSRRYLVQL